MINHDIALRVRSQSYGNILLNLKTILIFPKPFDFPRRKVLVSSHSYLVIMNNVSLYLEWCSEETKISIYSGGVPVRLWYKNSLERKNPNRDFVTMFVSLRARYYVFFFFFWTNVARPVIVVANLTGGLFQRGVAFYPQFKNEKKIRNALYAHFYSFMRLDLTFIYSWNTC